MTDRIETEALDAAHLRAENARVRAELLRIELPEVEGD